MDSEEAVSRIEGRVQSILGSHVLSNGTPDDPLSLMLRNGQPVFKTFDGQHWIDFETGQQVISTKSCDLSGLQAIPYVQFLEQEEHYDHLSHDVPENHPHKDVVLTHRTIPAPVPMFLANAQQLGLDF